MGMGNAMWGPDEWSHEVQRGEADEEWHGCTRLGDWRLETGDWGLRTGVWLGLGLDG